MLYDPNTYQTCATFPIEEADEPGKLSATIMVIRRRHNPNDRCFMVIARDGKPVINEIGGNAQYSLAGALNEAKKHAGWYS